MAKSAKTNSPAGVSFIVTGAARPGAGGCLAAYTSAWMELTGIMPDLEGKANPVPLHTVKAIAGATAVAYHFTKGNMVQTEKGVSLTEHGVAFFNARALQIDHEARAAYIKAMQTGFMDGQYIKNTGFIRPINK